MKKSIHHVDGSWTLLEGSPEEIATYEQSKPSRSLPIWPILPTAWPPPVDIGPHDPSCQLMIAQTGWWSIVPPACSCKGIDFITTTVSSQE